MSIGVWQKAYINKCSNRKEYWYADKVNSIVEVKQHSESAWGVEERSTGGQLAPHDYYMSNVKPGTTLRDVLPHDAEIYEGDPAYKHLDTNVVIAFCPGFCTYAELTDAARHVKAWPGVHKNVIVWFLLENGIGVAWNENISRGWSFPVKRICKGL